MFAAWVVGAYRRGSGDAGLAGFQKKFRQTQGAPPGGPSAAPPPRHRSFRQLPPRTTWMAGRASGAETRAPVAIVRPSLELDRLRAHRHGRRAGPPIVAIPVDRVADRPVRVDGLVSSPATSVGSLADGRRRRVRR